MVILDLVLKHYWYDRIKMGLKVHEYREANEYWQRRLSTKLYSHVRLRRGYTRENLLFEIKSIQKTKEVNDLGLPEVFKISLGARVGE